MSGTGSVEYAITVRPPWSQLIAEAAAFTALGVIPKLVENRGRPVAAKHIGTDIAIHAGKTWDEVGCLDPVVNNAWDTFRAAIGLCEPNPLLAAIGDTRAGYVGALSPGMWCETSAIVAVATFTGSHAAATPCPIGCTVPDSGVAVDVEFIARADCWSCPSCGWHTYGTMRTCCEPWGWPLHYNGKRARHLTFANVRRLDSVVEASGKQVVPWRLPPAIVSDLGVALAASH